MKNHLHKRNEEICKLEVDVRSKHRNEFSVDCQKRGAKKRRTISKCRKLLRMLLFAQQNHHRCGRQIKFPREISIRTTTVTLYTFLFNYELLTSPIQFDVPSNPCCRPSKKTTRKRFNAWISFNETFVFWTRKGKLFPASSAPCCSQFYTCTAINSPLTED